MSFKLFICLMVVCAVVFASARSIHVPSGWNVLSKNLDGQKELTIKIGLKPRDASKLTKTLEEISTPGSKSFRKYLTNTDIRDIVGRSANDFSRISAWVSQLGGSVVTIPPHADWVTVSLPVKSIETAFSCKLASFVHPLSSRVKVVALESYTIPTDMSDLIEIVAGMNSFPGSHWTAVSSGNSTRGGDSGDISPAVITPQTIYDVYQTDSSGKSGSKLGSQAVVEFGSTANFNSNDLQAFFKSYQTSLEGEKCGVVYGSNSETGHVSVEANLDVQYIMATGVYVNTSDYKITSTTRGESIEDEFLDYTLIVQSQINPPLVHSISYGEYGGSYDNATDQRFSYELQKMGIAGISVLLASGDNGVGCNSDGSSQEFDYPSSPYLTMVGATYINGKTNVETGATLSSGGFSLDFMQASWQASAVNGYLNSGVALPSEYFYPQGRAYPDVAAFGENVQVVASGKSEGVSGTSCSAPIFAGVIALLNNELLAAGKPPLGFLNPWLYANPQMFTDITVGSNPYEKCDGFQAAAGWDPVTGLGTPIYPKMLTAAFA